MSLIDQITQEIKVAMKAKDKVALGALRGIKKELIEANTASGAGDEISEEEGVKKRRSIWKRLKRRMKERGEKKEKRGKGRS